MKSFSELLREAREGREEALERIYRQYWGPILPSIRRGLSPLLRRRYDTLDIAQSIYADVLRDLPGFEDRGEAAFRQWLHLKAENKIRDKLRRNLGPKGKRAEAQLGSGASLPSPGRSQASEAGRREVQSRLADEIASLDDDARELVELRLNEGLKFGEIAERLGLPSADAARMRFARQLAQLRRRLGES